jgi:hypothetical protein
MKILLTLVVCLAVNIAMAQSGEQNIHGKITDSNQKRL